MKILFCIDSFRPSRGGAETYLSDLAGALIARGHDVRVAAAEIDADRIGRNTLLQVPAWPRLVREYMLARAPGRFVREGAFDLVVAFRHAFDCDLFQPHGGMHADSLRGAVRPAARGRFARCLLHGRKLLSPKNLLFLWIDRVLLRRRPPVTVAALSEMSKESIQRRARAGGSIAVIPNGVDGDRFSPALRARFREGFLQSIGLGPDARVGLFCGHNFVLKGLREALRGVALFARDHHDFHLVVAGRQKGGRYRRLAETLRIADRVHFLGECEEMEKLFGASDVLLHPTWYDPCSLVVLEALGSGVPVITTRFNGAAELMTSGREGFIVDDPRDAAALDRALRMILGPDHAAFAARAAVLGASRSFSNHVDKMEKLLLRVVEAKESRLSKTP